MPYSMQLMEQISNDPPRMRAKSTTTSNHPTLSLLLLTPTVGPLSNISSIIIGDNNITQSASARKLGAIFDEHLTMEAHVNSVCRSSSFHLHNISSIRRVLDMKTTSSLSRPRSFSDLTPPTLCYVDSQLYS